MSAAAIDSSGTRHQAIDDNGSHTRRQAVEASEPRVLDVHDVRTCPRTRRHAEALDLLHEQAPEDLSYSLMSDTYEEQGEKLRLRPKTIRDEEDMLLWWKKWRNMKDYDGEHESDQMSKRGLHVPTQNLRPTEGFPSMPASRSLWNRPKAIRGKEDMPSWWTSGRNIKEYDSEDESDQMSKLGLYVPTQNLRPTEGFPSMPASRSLWNRPKAIRGKEDMLLCWRNKNHPLMSDESEQKSDTSEDESEQLGGHHVPIQHLGPTESFPSMPASRSLWNRPSHSVPTESQHQ